MSLEGDTWNIMAMEVPKTKHNMRENENSLKRKVFALGKLRNREKDGSGYYHPLVLLSLLNNNLFIIAKRWASGNPQYPPIICEV